MDIVADAIPREIRETPHWVTRRWTWQVSTDGRPGKWDKPPPSNFSAKIVGEILHDDGLEQEHVFEIEACHPGRTSRFREPATRFSAMNWPLERLGASAIVEPGQGTRDRLRHAIQTVSGDVPTRTVYAHLGWRRIDGAWCYLHAAGAIGPNPRIGRRQSF